MPRLTTTAEPKLRSCKCGSRQLVIDSGELMRLFVSDAEVAERWNSK